MKKRTKASKKRLNNLLILLLLTAVLLVMSTYAWFTANRTVRIDTIDALGAAKLAAKLGASRVTLEDKIDYSVGIMLSVTEGDTVNKGDLLMNLYVKDYNQQFTESDFDFIQIVDL